MAYQPGSVYYYAPNKIAPVVTLRFRSWRTTGPMPWAALLLTAGFILREVGAFNYGNVPLLIAQSVLIMSGPPVYAGINYLILSRVLFYVPYLSPIHPGRVLTTFLAADAVCEVLIINGVQKIVDSRVNEHTRKVGNALTKAGLILQVTCFALFVLLAAVFHRRTITKGVCSKNIRTVLFVLYVSSTIITARCIYRIAEFFEYGSGPLTHTESYFWVFEATIMFINTAMMNIWHPGCNLPRSNRTFLSKDGKTEIRGPGYQDKRPFITTIADPFDIVGLVMGRDKRTKFWDWSPEELSRVNEEIEQKKIELDQLPRAKWRKVIDPLHLFDHKGVIVKYAKRLEKPGDDHGSTAVGQDELGSNKSGNKSET
ncbi:uncharacterized protein PV09_08435 [Verruconis gallopava]|uniref:RTA1 domain protein n=1 Tax=Verruconis gallopava TaxID=253628 RepID=A0A0D2ALF6_9PEZI|nr:uncharacterized protein PV09_08435 [Verruconis gallopava]KIV99908.1 hypothetical protein PV09_08435 [Verruconis gallopava]